MYRTGVWALCGAAALFALDGIGGVLVSFGPAAALWGQLLVLLAAVGVAVLGIWFYRSVVMRRWARREPAELGRVGAGRAVVVGLLVGAGFITATIAIAIAVQVYRVVGPARLTIGDVVAVLTLVVISAVLEELVFRGVLLQAFERWLGWIPALVITSLLFGAAHLGNPGATWFGALAIAVEAGFLLGAAFLWKRNLWFTIGLHAGWNALESLLGVPVSGEPAHGFLRLAASGPEFLTGGTFGIEASLIPMVLGAALGCVFLFARAVEQRQPARRGVGQ
ncbi:CPBP family intramembrane glutamic endopeptidase [Curtobacterium sp. ISL-83]|uniref:CPBP family intramembrane glutamic endopeptidase n=1 Tax=Curtobacterium sp. ISL-83 TaxID=2819145 RepID=UPI001BE622B9|nr:CPBP family intramembrane glutamic endopeptidase [Curtobacterium sp. ISL-83]MBT2502221.1 CPBP family intramembrane metalloprotease [Curtobacterium sp. ISL-83]